MAVPGSRTLVLFDDECPLCTFQMKVITWLDWFNTVKITPLSGPEGHNALPNLSREELLEAIHCVDTKGNVHRGARCIRHISMRMPLAVPIGLFLWFPGVIWIAEKVYMMISRNRHVLSRLFGCKGACAILPARSREHELKK
jgi:predicted DCC family thiol-disulfide oxidoreductase YuxK